ncbi:hypothetical protein ACFSZS_15225 [Seohaeicola zhoushanensis]
MIFLFPVFWMVLTSFKHQVDIFTNPPKFLFSPTLETYVEYMTRADINKRLANTIIVAFGSGVFSLLVGAMAGYALARVRIKGAATFGLLILLSRGCRRLRWRCRCSWWRASWG